MDVAAQRPWWERGVVYQIYPRSFQDSDGDGVGDIRGIESRLDYIASLGVDAIWLSPIFPSPMSDFGYDISDYCGIEPMFGSLADFDRLLVATHARGLKLLLDFVPNHSSDRHPWFVESRSDRNNPKRDWYIWRDARTEGGPPNNWISDFGGSAWTWDEAREQYYLRAFLPQQPDLNWRNPEVKAAMLDVLRFWLDRGVDGFRIDVLWHIIKAEGLPDNPVNPAWQPGQNERDRVLQLHSTDQPEAHAISAEMRALADRYGERVLIGEIFLPNERLARWHGTPESPQVHLPFNFALIENAWHAATLAQLIDDYEASLPEWGWPNWVLGSHDAQRVAARLGEAQARVAMMLLLTLRGTPTLYQGDELGIGAVEIPPHRVQDPRELRQPGIGLGRDPCRTPMAWDHSANGGFSSGQPWLPLHADWPTRNVADQQLRPDSMLSLTKRLLAMRRETAALSVGDYRSLPCEGSLLAFERWAGESSVLVALNLGEEPVRLPSSARTGRRLMSTLPEDGASMLLLRGNEGVVVQLSP
ncbi:alpha-amylase family glycosyl hydrolase [Altererythrobacter sp. Root672]|uniref:alpha-amylase family glycosyl hydrolase n=1 Tax=Altererythrobacter sp. Root672 TaxID=1736584 RepID=UPI0006FD379A|nr:alpha-amylase family glycosyl hydrolase [Altererythrobacter sp. Root672]KRA83988.1 alpha-amylase [Altererythrobacter sp. Root672]